MEGLIRKTTAVFLRPFTVPGFDETLPAGEYDLETELSVPASHLDPEDWKASVLVRLHPRESHPGLVRSLTVSLTDLDRAHAKDKMSGKELTELFLEDMLADPMIRLVMQADGISEGQLRRIYEGLSISEPAGPDQIRAPRMPLRSVWEVNAIQAAENEGMPSLTI